MPSAVEDFRRDGRPQEQHVQTLERLGLSPVQIASSLGLDVEQVRVLRERLRYRSRRGTCPTCGAPTPPGRAPSPACARCLPNPKRRWTCDSVLGAYCRWREAFGFAPSSYDWSATHSARRGGEAAARFAAGPWPTATVVRRDFGSFRALHRAAQGEGELG